jgi:hypothetical protein
MKMKKIYLLFLTITILAFNSCSSSENENLSETFLDKFNGKILKSDRTSNIRYYVFKNDLQNPLIIYANSIFQPSTNCFRIWTEYNSNDNLTILINEENKLRFRTDGNNNYYDVYTFTVVGDKIIKESYENFGSGFNESSSDLVESILTESDLTPICP